MFNFILGLMAGSSLGLILAALLGAAGHQSHREEVYEAYLTGFAAGEKKRGNGNG